MNEDVAISESTDQVAVLPPEPSTAIDPKLAMAYYQLGMANVNLGQLPEARKAFEGYLAADPNGAKAAEVQTFLKQLPQ